MSAKWKMLHLDSWCHAKPFQQTPSLRQGSILILDVVSSENYCNSPRRKQGIGNSQNSKKYYIEWDDVIILCLFYFILNTTY